MNGQLTGPLNAPWGRVAAKVAIVRDRSGFGAGVVVEPGLVVTNDHVVRSSRAVLTVGGISVEAQVVSRDRRNDLALVGVDSNIGPGMDVGDSDSVAVGQLVLAAGHPLQKPYHATLGILSGSTRGSWMGPMDRELLQLDVDLAPGNSGGPIVDAAGQLIGIATMIASPGIALAVPSNVVAEFVRNAKQELRGAA